MDATDTRMIRALKKCSFLPGSIEKRFITSLAETMAHATYKDLTPAQWYFMISLYHRYRGQISDHANHCVICKAMATNEPVIDLVCPQCGWRIGIIQKNKADNERYCQRCNKIQYSKFRIERHPKRF